MARHIDQERIVRFVNAVEKKKRYVRDPSLVTRHLFEEVAEFSRALWDLQNATDGLRASRRRDCAHELVDVISIACLLADILREDLNDSFPERFRAVAAQYRVRIPDGTL